jgi:hypothetical protein
MKYLSLFIFILFNSCSLNKITVIAKIIYIEPFPFATSLSGDLALENKQAAWVKVINSNDSLAVLFDGNLAKGEDISKKLILNNNYKFKLRKYYGFRQTNQIQTTKKQTDSLSTFIDSLPDFHLIDSTKEVRTDEYWLIESMEEIK